MKGPKHEDWTSHERLLRLDVASEALEGHVVEQISLRSQENVREDGREQLKEVE